MIKKLSFVAVLFAATLGLSAPQALADDCDWSGGTIVGTLGGAALGGFLGSQIGSGTGRLAFTGLGVLVGGLAGNQIAKALTCEDKQQMNQANQQAQAAPVGEQISWNNPDSGNSGTVTAVRDGTSQSGQYCREFEQTVTVDGKTEQGTGVACRKADGSWEVVDSPG